MRVESGMVTAVLQRPLVVLMLRQQTNGFFGFQRFVYLLVFFFVFFCFFRTPMSLCTLPMRDESGMVTAVLKRPLVVLILRQQTQRVLHFFSFF